MVTAPAVENAHVGDFEVVPPRRYGTWVAGALLVVLLAAGIQSVVTNPRLRGDVIRHYLLSPSVLSGIVVTLELTVLAMLFGLGVGTMLALMRLSDNRVLGALSWTYIWIFRAVPPLVQLIIWAFLGALYPRIDVGIPFVGLQLWSAPTNDVLQPFTAAIVGLSLIEAAYAAEVIRAGLLSVDGGQREAALSLGLGSRQIFTRIVLPQAMPAIIPPLGNNTIILLKGTSLVSVVGGAELMTAVQKIYAQNFEVIPLLMVASFWYLVITSLLSIGQYFLERHYRRGSAQHGSSGAPAGPIPELI